MSHHVRCAVIAIALCLSLAACGHEIETTSVQTYQAHYTLQSQRGAEAVTMPGHVSRYQRQVIVSGGPEPTSECGKNFDGIMDHLETLMAPQIAENNRIAAMQASSPSYQF